MTRSATTPNIFLFTDPAIGQEHGYYDGWVGDHFHYTGMGQVGDQEFTRANGAVLRHLDEGYALRLFRGARGEIHYLGEFALDEETPWYRMDAPETGGGPVRQVIVFRLTPVGVVVHDPEDELELPADPVPAQIEYAVTPGGDPVVVEIPVEEQHTERAVVNPSQETYESERREQALVLATKRFLGSTAPRSSGSGFSLRGGEAPVRRPLRQDLEQPHRSQGNGNAKRHPAGAGPTR
jgi:hypothetical protein